MMLMMKACRVQVYVHVATAYSLCLKKKKYQFYLNLDFLVYVNILVGCNI